MIVAFGDDFSSMRQTVLRSAMMFRRVFGEVLNVARYCAYSAAVGPSILSIAVMSLCFLFNHAANVSRTLLRLLSCFGPIVSLPRLSARRSYSSHALSCCGRTKHAQFYHNFPPRPPGDLPLCAAHYSTSCNWWQMGSIKKVHFAH